MTTRKLLPIVVAVGLLLAITATALAAPSAQRGSPWTPDQAAWDLTKLKVVDPGQTLDLPADKETGFPGGTLTSGYILEATAKARGGPLVPSGTFRLTLSAFSPNADMPGQRAGWWSITGDWTLVDQSGNSQALKARHNPFKVAGKVSSELEFNPLVQAGSWSARAVLPMSIAAGRWARGEGVFTLVSNAQGTLQLNLKLWPESPQRGG